MMRQRPVSQVPARHRHNDAGVSELIGAILLISLVVAMIAIVAVFLNSQAPTREIPHVRFMVGMNSQNPPTLFLTHSGGDTLVSGSFSVYVDGVLKPYYLSDGGNEWSIGKNLVIPLPTGSSPHNVVLVHNSTGTGATVLGSVSANLSSPQIIIPRFILPSPTPTPDVNMIFNDVANITNSSYFIPALQLNLSRNSVSFWKNKMTSGKGISGFTCNGVCYDNKAAVFSLRLTVTDANSTSSVTYEKPGGSVLIPLSSGDIVNFSFSGSDVSYLTTFGTATQIWEFAGNPITLNIRFANGTSLPEEKDVEILHTNVGGYSNLASTMAIEVWTPSDTALTVNGTQWINGMDSKDILLTNVRPVSIGIYMIASDSKGHNLYFIGNADKIYFDNVPQTLV